MRNRWLGLVIGVLIVLALAFAFTACGVNAGEVYDKTYEPARSWEVEEADYQYTCYPAVRYVNGKPQSYQDCQSRFVGYKTVTKHSEECYRIMFRNDDGDKGEDCVGEGRYNEIEIGDWYEK